jgi:quercetin dioxygenase-like cupin family protein
MGAQGIVVLPEQGSVWNISPGRSLVLKLLGGATEGSVMLFEEIVPAGTLSWFHLHRDSDEVAYVLGGEITFKIGDEITVGGSGTCAFVPRGVQHAWKNSGAETARVLFVYTPAAAGGLLEEQQRAQGTTATMSEREKAEQRQRYGWEIVGPNPL